MEVQQKNVIVRRQAQPHRPPRRSLAQVKRTAHLLGQSLLRHGLLLIRRHRSQIHFFPWQWDFRSGTYPLEQFPSLLDKGGPQHLVPLPDDLQGLPQTLRIHEAVQAINDGHVVRGRIGQGLLQEPHALLPKGHGQRLMPTGLFDGAGAFGMLSE